MTAAPIIESIRLVRFAIVPALAALAGGKGVYWLQASEGTAYPFVIVQSQDGGGQDTRAVGAIAWSGLITVKALAKANGSGNAQAEAEALMEQIAPGMANLSAQAGFVIGARHMRPIVLAPLDGVWQAAHLWRVTLERT
jgi:hypothetical protein